MRHNQLIFRCLIIPLIIWIQSCQIPKAKPYYDNNFILDTTRLAVCDSTYSTRFGVINEHFKNKITLNIEPTNLGVKYCLFDSSVFILAPKKFILQQVIFNESATFGRIAPKRDTTEISPENFLFTFVTFNKRANFSFLKYNTIDFNNCKFNDTIELLDPNQNFDLIPDEYFLTNYDPPKDSVYYSYNKISYGQCYFKSSYRIDGLSIKTLSFEGSSFFGDSLIISSVLDDAPIFTYARMPKYFSLSTSTVTWRNDLDLRLCNIMPQKGWLKKYQPKCTIIFNDETYHFNQFDPSKFIIPSDRFNIEFNKNSSYSQRMVILEKLKQKCQEEGMIQSVEDWDILYQQCHNMQRWSQWGEVINFFEKIWWNFGYSKWLIVVFWMPLFFLFFWLINFIKIIEIVRHFYFDGDLGGNFVKSYNSGEELASDLKSGNRSNRLYYSFFLTAVLFFGFKIEHKAVNYQNGLGMAYIYLVYLVGLFHVAYAVGFLLN